MQRFKISTAIILATAIFVSPSAQAAQVGKNNSAAKSPTASQSSSKYKSLMATQNAVISSCDALRSHLKDLISADVIERGISQNNSAPFNYLSMSRDEYETSDQYEKRKASSLETFFGKSGLVAFKTEVPEEKVRYDADRALLTVTLSNRSKSMGINEPSNFLLRLFHTQQNLGVRHGVTRMGVKFDYKAITTYTRQLHLQFPFDPSVTDAIEIHVAPSAAKMLKSNLRLASLGDMIDPYVEREEDEDIASLDDPTNVSWRKDTYWSKPNCLFLYNNSTGEIYKSVIPYEDVLGDEPPQ